LYDSLPFFSPFSVLYKKKVVTLRIESKKKRNNHGTCINNALEGQILVNIYDMSMIKDIKKAISYSSYELSMRDLEEGNVFVAEDADDLMRQCLKE